MTSRAAQAVALPALSLIAIFISLPPLALHWKNRNFPAASLICWFLVLNLINVANALIWPTDDTENWWDGQGLCDIEVKVLASSYVAVPGTLVCIFRSLAAVLDTRRTTLVPSKRQRWRNRAMELLFCVAVPIIAAATHVIYQGNRYIIYAIAGCVYSLDGSWVSLGLGYIWPLVLCFIGSYYCGLVLYRLQRYRSQFNEIIRSANSGPSKSRFLRLFFLSFIMLLALIPIQAYMVYMNIQFGLPWHRYSWSVVHGALWNEISKVPTNGKVLFDRWVPVSAGFMSFIFFGCGKDASRMYRSLLQRFGLGCFGPVQTATSGSFPQNTAGSNGSRAKLLFPGSRNQIARDETYHSARTNSTTDTYEDLEKGSGAGTTTRLIERPPQTKNRWLKTHFSWFSHPFSFSARREGMLSAPRLAVPGNTVSTNAWAGSSQSRGSIDLDTMPERTDFIRVKQVIKQEREMQV
ncbi:pheromone A receptor-domain-containing protein [Aspergillus cavernicola]|uniref:Pheromone A receptor-domain-containing protein n=1 Tax=Aspergillus cavernicola TaxID=176166 RepID=A0ABR4HER7_9EURO